MSMVGGGDCIALRRSLVDGEARACGVGVAESSGVWGAMEVGGRVESRGWGRLWPVSSRCGTVIGRGKDGAWLDCTAQITIPEIKKQT